jgi:myo-inositol-1(or 4)-monophosphatase
LATAHRATTRPNSAKPGTLGGHAVEVNQDVAETLAVASPGAVWQKVGVHPYERVAHAAAARAGALLRARYRDRLQVTFKGAVDVVTAADHEAEALIIDALGAAFPEHGIVAEESAARPSRDGHVWYVDPLDGTTNFAHGYAHFAVSMALALSEELVFALVYDPIREELFTAGRGEGARLNGAPIAVSPTAVLDHGLVGTGFPYDRREHAEFYLAFLAEAMHRAQGVRRSGSAALDLCWVGCGRLDAFWEWKLRPWDTAAGRLVVEEAGGQVSDFAGGPHVLDGDETAASNAVLHPELLRMLADVRRRLGRERP